MGTGLAAGRARARVRRRSSGEGEGAGARPWLRLVASWGLEDASGRHRGAGGGGESARERTDEVRAADAQEMARARRRLAGCVGRKPKPQPIA